MPIISSSNLDLYEVIQGSFDAKSCRDILLCDMDAQIALDNVNAEAANKTLGDYKNSLCAVDLHTLWMMVYESAIMTDTMIEGTEKVFVERSRTHSIDLRDIYRIDFERQLVGIIGSDLSQANENRGKVGYLSEGRRAVFNLPNGHKLWLNPENASVRTDAAAPDPAKLKSLEFSFRQFCEFIVQRNKEKESKSSMEI